MRLGGQLVLALLSRLGTGLGVGVGGCGGDVELRLAGPGVEVLRLNGAVALLGCHVVESGCA